MPVFSILALRATHCQHFIIYLEFKNVLYCCNLRRIQDKMKEKDTHLILTFDLLAKFVTYNIVLHTFHLPYFTSTVNDAQPQVCL